MYAQLNPHINETKSDTRQSFNAISGIWCYFRSYGNVSYLLRSGLKVFTPHLREVLGQALTGVQPQRPNAQEMGSSSSCTSIPVPLVVPMAFYERGIIESSADNGRAVLFERLSVSTRASLAAKSLNTKTNTLPTRVRRILIQHSYFSTSIGLDSEYMLIPNYRL